MKLFFMSDIHGSAFYLKQALAAYEREGASTIVILGDELYHGARNPLTEEYGPKEVTTLLNAHADHILAVRGNCDSEVDSMVLEYPLMATYSLLMYEGKRFFLTHGHIYSVNNLPPLSAGDVFCYGHTHVPVAEKRGNIYVLNPGSISLPKENSPHTYGVLEGNQFCIKDLSGHVYKEICFGD